MSKVRKYKPLTRKGNTLKPTTDRSDGQKRRWVNVRGRYKHELAIIECLTNNGDWMDSKSVCDYVEKLWPRTAPTTNRIANYLGALNRQGKVEKNESGKRNAWRIRRDHGEE